MKSSTSTLCECSFTGVDNVPRTSGSAGTHALDENQECKL